MSSKENLAENLLKSSGNKNINAESILSLKEYQQKRIAKNITLHKIFLAFTILVNIGMIIFIIFYKKKITKLENEFFSQSKSIEQTDSEVSEKKSTIDHKLVNIAAMSNRGLFRVTLVLQKISELQLIKKMIGDFYQEEKKRSINIDSLHNILLYSSMVDTDSIQTLFENIMFYDRVVLLFYHGNKKFGFFFEETVIPDDNDEFINKNKISFLFTFENEKKYKFIGEGNTFSINNEKFIIGDNDIVVNDKFFSKGGTIDFPFKSFDISVNEENVFSDVNKGKFDITYIEAFCFA